MKYFLALIAVFFVVFPVQAQQLQLTSSCINGLQDLNDADYKPTLEVNGKPVQPADLTEPVQAVQWPLQIPIEMDVIRFLELDIDDGIELDTNVTFLDVYEDGRVEYNGQDISDRANYFCSDDAAQDFQRIQPAAGDQNTGATDINIEVEKLESLDKKDATDKTLSEINNSPNLEEEQKTP